MGPTPASMRWRRSLDRPEPVFGRGSPGVAVSRAQEKFDDGPTLTHEDTREFVASYLSDFVAWVRRVS